MSRECLFEVEDCKIYIYSDDRMTICLCGYRLHILERKSFVNKHSIKIYFLSISSKLLTVNQKVCILSGIYLIFIFIFIFRATPVAHGSSQVRGRIRATAAGLHHSHSNVGSEPCLQSTPQLTAGIKPTSSWVLVRILVRFITSEPQWEPQVLFFCIANCHKLAA